MISVHEGQTLATCAVVRLVQWGGGITRQPNTVRFTDSKSFPLPFGCQKAPTKGKGMRQIILPTTPLLVMHRQTPRGVVVNIMATPVSMEALALALSVNPKTIIKIEGMAPNSDGKLPNIVHESANWTAH